MKKRIQIYLVFLLFVFLASCKGQGQTGQPKDSRSQIESDLLDGISIITSFNVITTRNAPTRITRKVKQDKEGNLLIAAFEDIIRYDGKSFTNFPKEKGLDSFDAFDVLEDSKGNLWIASTHLGVFLHDGKSFTRFTTNEGLAHNRSMCLYEDKAGNIWIGGQGGASRYNGKYFRNFTTKEGLAHNDVNTIMEDKTGKIWFGTRGDACYYDGKTFTRFTKNDGTSFKNVWSIIEDKKGNIWLAENGIWRYDGSSFTLVIQDGGGALYEDNEGNIWNTNTPRLQPSVLTRFDEKTLYNEKIKGIQVFKSEGMFLGISEDEEGNIWFGGDDGVWRYDGKTVNYFTGKQAKD